MTSKYLMAIMAVLMWTSSTFADPIPKKNPAANLPAKCKDGMKLVSESKVYSGDQLVLAFEMTRECKKIKATNEGTLFEWSSSSKVTSGAGQIFLNTNTILVGHDGKSYVMNGDKKSEQPIARAVKKGETEKSSHTTNGETYELERTWTENEAVEFKGKSYQAKVMKTVQTFKDRKTVSTSWIATIDDVELQIKSIQKTDQTVTEITLKEYVAGK